jgi:formylmethanofuran dehydrogenase subunit E
MKRAFLKIMMLRLISEKERTGYDLITHIGKISGRKPSAGSVYPLLQSMESAGWIEGQNRGRKTYYSLTGKGQKKLEEIKSMRSAHFRMLHESILLAGEALEEPHLEPDVDFMGMIGPLIHDIARLWRRGGSEDELRDMIIAFRKDLQENFAYDA